MNAAHFKQMLQRGQTLVLLALTVLIITLMVLMTLSISAKVRDRMELQTVADAAAYSDAIATARTLNTMAVMNRAMIAHTVSTIGTVSLISYATLYYNNATTARNIFAVQLGILAAGIAFWALCCMTSPPNPACCARMRACIQSVVLVGISLVLMTMHRNNLRNRLQRDQEVYDQETLPRFIASSGLYTSARAMFDANLKTKLNSNAGSFADSYLTQAKIGFSQANNAAAQALNNAELDRATVPNHEHSGDQPYQAGVLAMGSRGHPFVPRRRVDDGEWTWDLTLPNSLPNGTWADSNAIGRGYVNANITQNPNSMPQYGHPGPAPNTAGIWAHDNGNTVRTILVGSILGVVVTANRSTYYTCTIFGPLAIAYGLMGRSAPRAEVGPTVHSGVHSGLHSHPQQTFPSFYDFNQQSLFNGEDLYGQPRTVSVVHKTPPPFTGNYNPTNPWDLRMRGFMGSSFDMQDSPQALTGGRQVALGAGVTYYLRPDHHTEPPNMFAPFWHATLGRLTIDRPAAGSPGRAGYDAEVLNMLNGTGQSEAATAYQRLTQQGFLVTE